MQSAKPGKGGVRYRVWAPKHQSLSVVVAGREIPMTREADGVFIAVDPAGAVGDLYQFKLPDGQTLPDPGTHFQPQGVHGPSEVIDHDAFRWPRVDFNTPPLSDLIFYECHIGTFTREG